MQWRREMSIAIGRVMRRLLGFNAQQPPHPLPVGISTVSTSLTTTESKLRMHLTGRENLKRNGRYLKIRLLIFKSFNQGPCYYFLFTLPRTITFAAIKQKIKQSQNPLIKVHAIRNIIH